MNLKSVTQAGKLSGKVIFMRGDFDAPLTQTGTVWEIGDESRLLAMRETLDYLRQQKARILLAGHIDRPGGKPDPNKSTKVIAQYFGKIYPDTKFNPNCCGTAVKKEVKNLALGQILVLENLRFLPGEEENDEDTARSLANLADFYVNESFSNSHRDHASMTGITEFLPSFAGFRLLKEVDVLSSVLENPSRPLYVIIGGSKVETKLPVIKNFVNVADRIYVGGKTGCSKEELTKLGPKVTFACGDPDLSFNTAKEWAVEILNARTIVWNGPLGNTGNRNVLGTDLMAQAVVEATKNGARSIVGGGDTEDFLRSNGSDKLVSFISTGGGAMLDYLAGVKMPALEALIQD